MASFLMTWTIDGKTESREWPEERLQEMLDRAWRKFGDGRSVVEIPPRLPDPRVDGLNTPARKRRG